MFSAGDLPVIVAAAYHILMKLGHPSGEAAKGRGDRVELDLKQPRCISGVPHHVVRAMHAKDEVLSRLAVLAKAVENVHKVTGELICVSGLL